MTVADRLHSLAFRVYMSHKSSSLGGATKVSFLSDWAAEQ